MRKLGLLIDDEPDFVSNLRELFEIHGYEIIVATNGEEGLENISRFKIDFIISDINMPLMDGFQFIEKLNNNGFHRKLPLIFLSASFSESEKNHLIKNGAVACLNKLTNYKVILKLLEEEFLKNNSNNSPLY